MKLTPSSEHVSYPPSPPGYKKIRLHRKITVDVYARCAHSLVIETDTNGDTDMNLTITKFRSIPCSKCGGRGFLPQFQYHKSGECFRCGTSGFDPVMLPTTRDMTDEEVVAALEFAGFPIVSTEEPAGFMGIMLSEAQVAAQAEAMIGARLLLAAI